MLIYFFNICKMLVILIVTVGGEEGGFKGEVGVMMKVGLGKYCIGWKLK